MYEQQYRKMVDAAQAAYEAKETALARLYAMQASNFLNADELLKDVVRTANSVTADMQRLVASPENALGMDGDVVHAAVRLKEMKVRLREMGGAIRQNDAMIELLGGTTSDLE